MRFNEVSKDVQRLQEALLNEGYDLPLYGADGHLGSETWAAMKSFSDDKNLEWNPLVPKSVRDTLKTKIPAPIVPDIPKLDFDVKIFDMRSKQSNPPEKKKKFKLTSKGKVFRRSASSVNGITIHQTAVKYSINKKQLNEAKGDKNLALANRSLGIACHVTAFHDGFVAWPNPLDWYVYHAGPLNSRELGIEIDGNYPGVIGGDTWNNKPATKVTDELVDAACAGIELLVMEGRKLGMPIKYIHAHRQSSDSRRNDPGEELWKRVVLDYCVPVLGLATQPARTFGNGRPIPVEWDPNGVGSY